MYDISCNTKFNLPRVLSTTAKGTIQVTRTLPTLYKRNLIYLCNNFGVEGLFPIFVFFYLNEFYFHKIKIHEFWRLKILHMKDMRFCTKQHLLQTNRTYRSKRSALG